MPVQLVLDLFAPAPRADREGLPGRVRERIDVPSPAGYAVFDCETTGTDVTEDEIVSLALIRLDRDGREESRYTVLVRPSRPIPAEATAVHGISDGDVEQAPRFAQIAPELLALLGEAVFVAHNASFDLGMLRHAFGRESIEYRPGATACTLEAFRLLEPLADNHRLQTICDRRGVVLADAHDAMSDVLATTALLRVLLDEGIAPETVELDHNAYMRLRSRGDNRPASEPQIRRVFGLARSAGLVLPDGTADREQVAALVFRVTGVTDVDALTRAQVQDVYDALEELIEQQPALAPAASAIAIPFREMTTTEVDIQVGARFLDALTSRDYDALGACFAVDGKLRGIVPPGLREALGREAIVERFRIWTEDISDYELAESDAAPFADLLRLRWAVRGVDPEVGLNVYEQTAYAEVVDGEIVRMRLACSGHRPL